MKTPQPFFQIISYLQYPLMIIALYFVIQPYLGGFEAAFEDSAKMLESLNKMFIFMGLSISFSTLQDTTKTQNEISRKVWENPRKSRFFLSMLSITILFVLVFGVYMYLSTSESALREVSFGAIVLGIGMMGMLKSAKEMADYHQNKRIVQAGLDDL